jgi:predicted lysophospholipase L1 biosynthesis ABC-type transport system permease subunit
MMTLAGGLLCLIGFFLSMLYVWETVMMKIGDPDQSALFWYLPLLLFGLIAIKGGWKLISRGKT